MDLSEERHSLLARVASPYYENNLTQAEIACRPDISRPQVSRLLAESRQEGVVQVTINYPPEQSATLKQQFLEHFDVKDVKIVASGNLGYAQLVERLGVLDCLVTDEIAARVLLKMLES